MEIGEKQSRGRQKGMKIIFRTRYKDITNGLTTHITSFNLTEDIRSFTIKIGGHYLPEEREGGLEALKRLDRDIKKDLRWHLGVNGDIWNVLISDLDYFKTPFTSGSSYVELDITTILHWGVTEWDACRGDVMRVLELVKDILEDAPFTYTEKKIKRK